MCACVRVCVGLGGGELGAGDNHSPLLPLTQRCGRPLNMGRHSFHLYCTQFGTQDSLHIYFHLNTCVLLTSKLSLCVNGR